MRIEHIEVLLEKLVGCARRTVLAVGRCIGVSEVASSARDESLHILPTRPARGRVYWDILYSGTSNLLMTSSYTAVD